MARTQVTIAKTVRTNASPSAVATITKQAIDDITGAGNGIEISDFFLCTENTLIIENTAGSDKVITLIAGEHSSAVASGAGDKDITIVAARNAASPAMIDQIESARFKKDDGGGLVVEFAAGMTGYVYAIGKSRGIG